jgi:hypothetical protein
MGLVTIIYCLRFETSLFVASYDSQGYGGGIRPRHHAGVTPELMSSPLYSLFADRIWNTFYKGYVVTEMLPTPPLYSSCIPLLF